MLESLPDIMASRDSEQLEALDNIASDIDASQTGVLQFLGQLGKRPLSKTESKQLLALIRMSTELKCTTDIVVRDIVPSFRMQLQQGFQEHPQASDYVEDFYLEVLQNFRNVVHALKSNDLELARKVYRRSAHMDHRITETFSRLGKILSDASNADDMVGRFRAYVELSERLRRIDRHSHHIAGIFCSAYKRR